MDIGIPIGIKHHMDQTVTKEKSARAFGSGQVDVFATPAMIAFMEKTCMESILSHLPEGYTSVGTEVNVKHLKATPIGRKVSCDTYLKSVNGIKLTFELHAWDDKGMIGIGTHTRVVVKEKDFVDKLK